MTFIVAMCSYIMTFCTTFGTAVAVNFGLMLTETTSSTIDMNIVTMLIDLVKAVLELFTIFPLNVFLIAGLVGVAFGIFRNAKGAAKGR